jgi:hypothetical protein
MMSIHVVVVTRPDAGCIIGAVVHPPVKITA